VDTASSALIFHPKIYAAIGDNRAQVVIGSANLTHPGLFNNVEASAVLELDLSDSNDADFLRDLTKRLEELPAKFPQHCYQIGASEQTIDLVACGILEDESIERPDTGAMPSGHGAKKSAPLPKILLPFTSYPKKKKVPKASPVASASKAPPAFGQLVWEKPRLATDRPTVASWSGQRTGRPEVNSGALYSWRNSD
jgi:hypothetical protein